MYSQSNYEQIHYSKSEQSDEFDIEEVILVIEVRISRSQIVYIEYIRVQYLRGKNYSHKLHQSNKTHQGEYLKNHRYNRYGIKQVGFAIEIRTDTLFEGGIE